MTIVRLQHQRRFLKTEQIVNKNVRRQDLLESIFVSGDRPCWRIEVMMNTQVSILAEIPEELHASLKEYLDTHPNWDQDRVFAAALSLFLLQNGDRTTTESIQNYRACARVYLESIFQ